MHCIAQVFQLAVKAVLNEQTSGICSTYLPVRDTVALTWPPHLSNIIHRMGMTYVRMTEHLLYCFAEWGIRDVNVFLDPYARPNDKPFTSITGYSAICCVSYLRKSFIKIFLAYVSALLNQKSGIIFFFL